MNYTWKDDIGILLMFIVGIIIVAFGFYGIATYKVEACHNFIDLGRQCELIDNPAWFIFWFIGGIFMLPLLDSLFGP